MNSTDKIGELYNTFLKENERFVVNKVKSAAPRARKALAELTKACKARRIEIMDEKKAMDENK